MRKVYDRFPENPDVCTLFAESLMNRTPWKLWDLKTGDAAEGASTAEVNEVLDTALRRIEDAEGSMASRPASHVHPSYGDVVAPGDGLEGG